MHNFNFQINNLGCPDNQIRYGDHCYSSLFQPITQSCISNGKICDGDDLTTIGNTADTAQCQEFCQGTEGCLYWVYDTVTRNCDYKNADMTDKCTDGGTANKYSGPKSCSHSNILTPKCKSSIFDPRLRPRRPGQANLTGITG